jgi:DNA-binding NtrC family response regulator
LGNQTIRVCLLSQDSGLAKLIASALGEDFETRLTGELQFPAISDLVEWCDVVLLDLRTVSVENQSDHEKGMQLLDEIVQAPPHPPVVALCDADDRQMLLGVIERGAFDSTENPPNVLELRLILHRAYKFFAAENELYRLRKTSREAGKLHELLGASSTMQELFALAQKVGPCDVNVLITGETGTGKELLARAIHQLSPRSARPLVAFSCVNLPETLIEDELFGHERGAFTGALACRRGRIEVADQGTLFMDEIGDLSLGLQPKLLRVLQQRTFERLGGNTTVNVNVRLISATHHDLPEMVKKEKFREDLYYRLNVVQMHLPPLRERREDIPLLARHFLQRSSEQFKKNTKRFSRLAMSALEEYNWPGNVRELENVVQRAVVLAEGQTVDSWYLPANVQGGSQSLPTIRSYEEEVRQFKRRLVLRTLRECGWRKAESARSLDVARGYLHRLINQLGIRETEGVPPAEPPDVILPPRRIM